MMKVDESFKDPYTDAELDKLLKRPTGDSLVEWRCWAAINTFLGNYVTITGPEHVKQEMKEMLEEIHKRY
jgi:hypothetical protein